MRHKLQCGSFATEHQIALVVLVLTARLQAEPMRDAVQRRALFLRERRRKHEILALVVAQVILYQIRSLRDANAFHTRFKMTRRVCI